LVLGPVLFILFLNDLPHYIGEFSQPLIYADDTTLLLNGRTADDIAVSSYIALNMAFQYCNGNGQVGNPTKTSQYLEEECPKFNPSRCTNGNTDILS
jgi:hypothetical protein